MFRDRTGLEVPVVREAVQNHSYSQIVPYAARRAQAKGAKLSQMWGDTASARGASMSSYVIGISVAALIVAIIVPIAFGQFFAVNTGSWDAQTILIWGILPLVIILAIVLFFLNRADDQA